MALSQTGSAKPTRTVPLRIIVNDACRDDDVSIIKRAINLATLPTARTGVQDVLSHAVTQAIRFNAENILSHILDEGGSVPISSNLPCQAPPSRKILEILIAHGWDVNARYRGSKPFLWQAVADHDTVVWALDHGAEVQPRDQEPYADDECLRDHTDCLSILEQAVLYGCQPRTFDLLRSRGAPMTRRVLHFAVEHAVCIEACLEPRLALVRHLLDSYDLDVNAFDAPEGASMGNHWGTPLCYVAQAGSTGNCKDVVELLLQRGADPDLCARLSGWSAMTLAEQKGNIQFMEIVTNLREGVSQIEESSPRQVL